MVPGVLRFLFPFDAVNHSILQPPGISARETCGCHQPESSSGAPHHADCESGSLNANFPLCDGLEDFDYVNPSYLAIAFLGFGTLGVDCLCILCSIRTSCSRSCA